MGKEESSPGRRSGVYETWEVAGRDELKEVKCSWSPDSGAEMRNKAGEAGGHQMITGLKSHGKAWPFSRGEGEVVEGVWGGVWRVMLIFQPYHSSHCAVEQGQTEGAWQ